VENLNSKLSSYQQENRELKSDLENSIPRRRHQEEVGVLRRDRSNLRKQNKKLIAENKKLHEMLQQFQQNSMMCNWRNENLISNNISFKI